MTMLLQGPPLASKARLLCSHKLVPPQSVPMDGVIGVGEEGLKSHSQVGGKTGGSERGGGSRALVQRLFWGPAL